MMKEHDDAAQKLLPESHGKMTSSEIMIVVAFALAVPLILITQLLGLGLPGLVIGGILAAVLAGGGTSALRHMPGLPEIPSFDWSVLFAPVTIEGDTLLLGRVVDADPAQPRQDDNLDTQDEQEPGPARDPVQDTADKAPTDVDALFQTAQNTAEDATIPRLGLNDIVRHTERNRYRVCIGRSLTKRGNPPVWINLYGQHLKLIGASQYGKSSLAAAILYLITRTHTPSHVLIALLDMEHKTSKLFADIPHLAEVMVNDQPVVLHAKNRDQVLTYLRYVVAVMDERYTLSEEEVEQEPILLVYLEEFLALKDYFKRLIDALSGEAKEQAKKNYAQLVYYVSEIARRGLKVKVQLLMCAQVDYRDDDFQEALVNITGGMSFCVRVSAALAAGFTRTDLLRRNVEADMKGQAVVETPDCKDLVRAPEFDLKKKLLAFEQARQASNPRPLESRTSMLAPARSRPRSQEEELTPMPGIADLQPVPNVNQRKQSEIDLEKALAAYDQGNTTINALALALGMSPWNVRPLYTQVKRLRENAS